MENTARGVRSSGKYSTWLCFMLYLPRDPPKCCIFCTARLCSALTGLLFCVGGHQLMISSCVCSYSVFVSFFVVKAGKKLSSKPGCKKVAAKLETKRPG